MWKWLMWVLSQLNSTHIISISPLKTSTGSGNVQQSISQRQKLSNLWSNESKNYLPRWRGLCASCMFVVFFQSVTKQCYLVGGFNPSGKNISQIGNLCQVGVKTNNIWNHHLVVLPLYVSTTKITVELCISRIITILHVRVTIWLSIIVVFSSKWSNKGHMLSAQVSTFKFQQQVGDDRSSDPICMFTCCEKVNVFMSQYPAIDMYNSTDSWSVYHLVIRRCNFHAPFFP